MAEKGRRGGRGKTPAHLKAIEGRGHGRDSGGRKITPPPPFKRRGPEPPEDLGEYARSVWDETAPELVRLDLTKPEDRHALASYCQVVEQAHHAYLQYRAKGLTVFNAAGSEVVAPWVSILDKTSRELRAWAREFGLTPSAESNLKAKETAGDGDDPYASQSAASG